MIHVGFTGTRHGMTDRQARMLQNVLSDLMQGQRAATLHHGCCVGADAQAHYIAGALGYRTHGHPSNLRGQCAPLDCDVMENPLPPLDRNRVIVARCTVLVAAPATGREVLRSGTWATVRYARQAGRPRWLLLPDQRTPLLIR